MGRSGCFDKSAEECAYSYCLSKFRDENGNKSTITTTQAPIVTTEQAPPPPLPDKSGLFFEGNFPIYIGAGSGGFVVFCIIVILCLCRSRNREKHKRRVIEEDYRVVATTLTNVNDSDGTTYEELCIDNPHYNRHDDVILPYKKDRKRLPGISVCDTFKRLVSDEGKQAAGNASKSVIQASNKPLPPIPGNYRRDKEAASNKLSESIDEYTEIGSEVKRRTNVYNPLDMDRIGHPRDSHGTYESLRESRMIDRERPPIGLPAGEYFILAKEDKEIEQPQSPGEYMILAKEEEEETSTENDRLLQNQEITVLKKEMPELEPYAESSRCLIEDEADSGICESGGHKNDYYVLEKDAGEKNRDVDNTDYIEPVKGDRHSYMQVLPEHSALCRK